MNNGISAAGNKSEIPINAAGLITGNSKLEGPLTLRQRSANARQRLPLTLRDFRLTTANAQKSYRLTPSNIFLGKIPLTLRQLPLTRRNASANASRAYTRPLRGIPLAVIPTGTLRLGAQA